MDTSRHTPLTSPTLLLGVRQGDASAWSRFAYVYSPMVYGWARRASLQASDASDVVQEVFRAVASSLDQFERLGGGSFRGWLWTITRNEVRNHFRRLAKHAEALGGDAAYRQMQDLADVERDGPPDSTPEAAHLELSRLGRRAMESVRADFEESTWRIFWRAAVEGDAAADIAADWGITKWAVYKAKSRVLQRLREEFGEILN